MNGLRYQLNYMRPYIHKESINHMKTTHKVTTVISILCVRIVRQMRRRVLDNVVVNEQR